MIPSRDDWNAHWHDNDAAATENPAQAYRHDLILDWLKQAKVGEQGMRLIDFGCGQGDFLLKASQRFPNLTLTGFELSEEGARITSQKVLGAQILQADLLNPPPETREFQSWATHAVCSEVLEHLDDPGRFLRAINPYLVPGAYVIITVPSGPMSAFDRRIGHRQHFSVPQLRELMEKNGLSSCEVQRAGFPFHNLYRLTVIARGDRVAHDAREVGRDGGHLARLVMRIYAILFRVNLSRTPFGWQLIARAQKEKAAADMRP
jgi:cyclopropane fatty-acyl-phospholipid synthase-like methyltransferase